MRITREDAFRILGVTEESSPDEIRSCYKKLALKWHPDKHGDSNVTKDEATLKFQEVSAAYKRLTTNMNDADDEIDDSEFMNIREMMELFAHIFFHNGVRGCPHHGMDCCDYEDDEYFYSDDEYYDYTDEESEDEFLDSIAHRLRNKYEQRKYKPKDKTQSQRHNITEEEALRNARELIEEEEQEKKREEKKKAKRKKKKEKKKQKDKEKKEQEIITNNKTEKSKNENNKNNSNKENNNPKIDDEKPTTQLPDKNKQDINNTSGKKSKGSESNKNKNKQDGKKDNSKNKNNKNTEADQDEELIDTNSAFFAHAASKAPPANNINTTTDNNTPKENTNNKKKKGGQSSHQQNNNSKKKKVPPPLSTTSSTSSTSPNTTNNIPTSSSTDNRPTTDKTTPTSTTISTPSTQTNTPSPKNNSEPKTTVLTNGIHKSEDVILKSRQVAVQGNQLAQQNNYTGAVEMFSQAILLDPTDFRFFGNRSYCYDRLEKYTKALDDADAAIELSPEWPKGFFRKGRALTGLKRFQEAEQVFQQVLKLDPTCEDAQFELARVRVQILMDMGFTQSMSEQAVRTYSTVQQALEALLAGKVSDEEGSDDVYFSEEDNDIEDDPPSSPTYHTVKSQNKNKSYKQKAPAQPKCTALWVGNVDPQLVTDKQMSQLFSKCGKVSSVRILPHKYCAFVNYVDSASAAMAMEKLQGAGLGSQKLLLRFPNNPPPGSFVPEQLTVNTKQPTTTTIIPPPIPQKTSPSISESSNDSSKVSGPVNGNECYFWRTTGCVFENQCRYKHVRGHKGVDLPKVQAKYGKLPSSS